MPAKFRRDGPLSASWPAQPGDEDEDLIPADVVILPRGPRPQSDPYNSVDDGTNPATQEQSFEASDAPGSVGDGPIVWRPAARMQTSDVTVELQAGALFDAVADSTQAQDQAAPQPYTRHVVVPDPAGLVELGTSAVEKMPEDRNTHPSDRTRAIAIGLLVGAAVGLVIDAFLFGWMRP